MSSQLYRGNPDDEGYVVEDAIRLNEAVSELVGLFRLMSVTPQDETHCTYAFYQAFTIRAKEWDDRDDWSGWIADRYLKAMAEKAVRQALISGDITVWTADRQGERRRDSGVLFTSPFWCWASTFESGHFRVNMHLDSPPDYVRARLWVKADNWADVRSQLVMDRVRSFQSALPHGLDKLLKVSPAVKAPEPATPATVDFDELTGFIADMKRVDGVLPHATRGEGSVYRRVNDRFAPRHVKREIVQEALLTLGLARPQGRPRKSPD
ncbi:hypothetical protein [Sphingobium yanoikuyae]|uniref:hypothetical protein n=1 Tax=Sphingobium yanoikuyae TaxID=13690 RepID=UPI00111065A4|nr:hypothetical protein [Sphingobium yanoikuyae]